MVLVAVIAAGVLVETAGFLQDRSEETGEQSSQQVTDRVQVISKTGSVVPPNSNIGGVSLNIKKAPGAGDIDVGNATVVWVGPGGSEEFSAPSGPP